MRCRRAFAPSAGPVLMHAYRTHTCGALRLGDAGQTARLSGWVHRKRDHGQLLFVDLRDHYGITQCVIDVSSRLFAQAEALRLESVVTMTGRVTKRSEDTINPSLPTGEVELVIDALEVQSVAEPLPFPVNTDAEYPEDMRLTYRFLDLRREDIHAKMMLRSAVIVSIRRRMIEQGFTEFQTPILTADSPEGARPYLVPSRIHPGEFYALPQAPQQFKQLLMVSGFDRYFQIAPCFRDEAARVVRAIPAPNSASRPRSSFQDKMDAWAKSEMAAPGLGYITLEGSKQDLTGRGPIANNLSPDELAEIARLAGVGAGDVVFFAAGAKAEAERLAGRARLRVGQELGLIEEGAFRFCWVVDYPMYERIEETGQIEFSHNPFSMPQGGLDALETQDPLQILAH